MADPRNTYQIATNTQLPITIPAATEDSAGVMTADQAEQSALTADFGADERVFIYARPNPNTFDSLPAGSDVTGDGSATAPYATITKAIRAVPALQRNVRYFVDVSGVHESLGGVGELTVPPFVTPDRLLQSNPGTLVTPVVFDELPINVYGKPILLATLSGSFTSATDPTTGLRTYTDPTATWTPNQWKGKYLLGGANGQFAAIASNSDTTLEVCATTAFTGTLTINDYSASLTNPLGNTRFTLSILASGVQIQFSGMKFLHATSTFQAVFTADALATRFTCCELQGLQAGRSRFVDMNACYIRSTTAISAGTGGVGFNFAGNGNANGINRCFFENVRHQINSNINTFSFGQNIYDGCVSVGHGGGTGTGLGGILQACLGLYKRSNEYIRNSPAATQGGVAIGGHGLTYFGGGKCQVDTTRIQSCAGSALYAENPGRIDLTSVVGPAASGAAASIVSGAPTGMVRVTGLTGMFANAVGSKLTISGAASAGNNGSFQIIKFISATEVYIINASAVTGDANNGSISWTHRNAVYGIDCQDGAHVKITSDTTLVTGALGDLHSGAMAARTYVDFRANAPLRNQFDVPGFTGATADTTTGSRIFQ